MNRAMNHEPCKKLSVPKIGCHEPCKKLQKNANFSNKILPYAMLTAQIVIFRMTKLENCTMTPAITGPNAYAKLKEVFAMAKTEPD